MATADNIQENFEDLGFVISEAKILDQLVALCDLFKVDEAKLSCEYLAFAAKKKVTSEAPNAVLLDQFEKELAKCLNSKAKSAIENITSTTVYNAASLGQAFNMDESYDPDEGALSFYATPDRCPVKSKRLLTPDNSTTSVKRLLGENGPLPFSPTTFKVETPGSDGKQYANRANRGQVLIRFHGNDKKSDGATMPASFWKCDGQDEVKLKQLGEAVAHGQSPSLYMFEKLRDKAGHLDEIICRLTDQISSKHWHNNEEIQDMCQVMPESFFVSGRICCDASEGRFNNKSILLQGSLDVSLGRAVALDVSQVKEYALFPGQIITAEVTNPSGNRLVATRIWSDASRASPKSYSSIGLHMVVASGPFTTSDNLDYEPLLDLLHYVRDNQPHLLILIGPFVDERHPMIESGNLKENFNCVFQRVFALLSQLLSDVSTQVAVVASQKDAHHHPIYPTPAFQRTRLMDRFHLLPDPCVIEVEGVTIGITATDVLFHLGKEEISYPPNSGDRLRRLATHLIQQQNFYPRYPPHDDVYLDFEKFDSHVQMPLHPHILILPSDLLHFFKSINDSLVVNPQRLTRGQGGNVFARIVVEQHTKGDQPFTHHVHGEILRI